MVGALAAQVDRVFNEVVLQARRPPERAPDEGIEQLRAFVARWNEPRWFDDVDGFFGAPVVPRVTQRRVRAGRAALLGRGVEDLQFQSPHRPHFGEVGARLASFGPNRVVPARRILAGARPARAVAVLVHGYLGGAFAAEEWVWPLDAFARRGVDVVLAVLPFHGARNDRRVGKPPRWPGPELAFSLEGHRQVVADLRALVAWLYDTQGYAHVGMMGMSLGGFATALLATTEPRLAFAVPYIPLASVADWTRDAGQLPGSAAQQAELHHLIEEAHALTSPLSRPLRAPRAGCFVAVAERDAITPMRHGERIAQHFRVPLEVFPGGHLLQAGRGRAFERLFELVEGLP
ncbi:MAG: CocE/NonD family hydrolase [Polyangiales bacterium]